LQVEADTIKHFKVNARNVSQDIIHNTLIIVTSWRWYPWFLEQNSTMDRVKELADAAYPFQLHPR